MTKVTITVATLFDDRDEAVGTVAAISETKLLTLIEKMVKEHVGDEVPRDWASLQEAEAALSGGLSLEILTYEEEL